jgi:hypothetical protein
MSETRQPHAISRRPLSRPSRTFTRPTWKARSGSNSPVRQTAGGCPLIARRGRLPAGAPGSVMTMRRGVLKSGFGYAGGIDGDFGPSPNGAAKA